VLKELKRRSEALQAFDNALAINANVADTWSNRGTVLNDLDRFEEAFRDFDQAIARKSDFADAFSPVQHHLIYASYPGRLYDNVATTSAWRAPVSFDVEP
jgi:tetratricopeptide (TPR) repeat protein